jgi:LPXTG-motif cell wall-anchored protein
MVLADGSLGIVYTSITAAPVALPGEEADISPGNSQLEFALAPAAGSTPFPLPIAFTQVSIPVASDRANAVRYQRASDGLPAAAVDPVNGDIYITWDDGRFRTDGVNDIVFTHSGTGGLTWDPVFRIPASQGAYLDSFNSMVAAGGDGGVHVAYLQRGENTKANRALFSPTIDVFHLESHDKGKTWSRPLKVSSQPSYYFHGAFSRNGLFQGDYNQLVTSGGYTYIVRERAYPLTPGEAPGLVYDPTLDVYTGDMSKCTTTGAVVTNAPGCLSHQHQRTWVAVLGPATSEVAGVNATPSVLPNTSGPGTSLLALLIGIAAILAGLGAITIRRRRFLAVLGGDEPASGRG